MTNRGYADCPHTSSHFSNASAIIRILLISLSFPLIVAIRCWGVIPSVSPKMRRMRSIQARTRFHNVSAMRPPSMSEKSLTMVGYFVNHLYVPSYLIHFKGFYERHRSIRGEQDVPCGVSTIFDKEDSNRYIS